MNRSKSGLFLMEIMFAVLFFSIASAVCLQLFAKAHTLGEDTVTLDRAVNICQNAAAILDGADMDALCECYPNGQWQNHTFIVPFDSGSGTLFLCVTEDETAYQLRIPDAGSDEPLFSLELVKRIP